MESGLLDRGGCEPEGGYSVDGDFGRVGRSMSITFGIGFGNVASVPFARLGCPASAVFWKECGHAS